MEITQIYTDNSLRNYNYIIACPKTLEAVVIDPLRVDLILDIAEQKKYNITKIINTHDHADHTDGNEKLSAATNAEVYCHNDALNRIPLAKHGLRKDDLIAVGETLQLKVLDTPGHTMAHVCLLASDIPGITQAIFSGDTLFNAGCGHVRSGNIDALYNTFVDILYKLSDDTLVYPGHDYLENNLKFTLSREPDNKYASKMLQDLANHDPHNSLVTTLGTEKQMNTFFRLTSQSLISQLKKSIPNFADKASQKEIFVALRSLRNEW